MLLEMDRNCFIAPSLREAEAMARMLSKQGDMRGIIDADNCLIVFDSYGNTHNSAREQLKLRYAIGLIFRLSGEIFIDCSFSDAEKKRNHKLEKVFDDDLCRLFRRMYKYMAVEEVTVTCWD